MMSVDKMEFFREFSLRICGSLDIEKALYKCLLYLKQLMPVDELLMLLYDASAGVVEMVASADGTGGHAASFRVDIPAEVRKELEHLERQEYSPYPQFRIADDTLKDPVMSQVGLALNWPKGLGKF